MLRVSARLGLLALSIALLVGLSGMEIPAAAAQATPQPPLSPGPSIQSPVQQQLCASFAAVQLPFLRDRLLNQAGCAPLSAAPLRVCKSGCPYNTIKAAVEAAAPGSTIQIGEGRYEEGVPITKNLSLVGEGRSKTTILGAIDVFENASVNINNLGVTGAQRTGIRNEGVLVLVNVEVSHGFGSHAAGGISNEGNLTLVNSSVHHNSVFTRGGGIYNNPGGRLTLLGSTVQHNESHASGAVGAGIYNAAAAGNVILDRASTVSNNKPDDCVNVIGC